MAATITLDPVILGDYTIRELPEEEWPRLMEVDGPLMGVEIPPSDTARIIGVEYQGTLIGYWVISAVIHIDPLYLTPAHRHRPDLTLAFVGALVHTLQRDGTRFAFAVIADAQPENGIMAERLGFIRVPGALYAGTIPPLTD